MEKRNDELSASFTLPERVTVRMQMRYYSAAAGAIGEDMIERYWEGAKTIIEDWKCDLIPNIHISLDDVTNPKMTGIMIWAGMEVRNFMARLDAIEKN